MENTKSLIWRRFGWLMAVALLLQGLLPLVPVAAQAPNLYTPQEFTIVSGAEFSPSNLDLSADWVAYQPYEMGSARPYRARNLKTGAEITFPGSFSSGARPLAMWEDTVAWVVGTGPAKIELFNVTTGERRNVVETDNAITAIDYREGVVVWLEYTAAEAQIDVRALDVEAEKIYDVAVGPEHKLGPRVWGDLVVWEQAAVAGQQRDVYGFRLSDGKAFPISANPWDEYSPVVYENTVVWVDQRAAAVTGPDIYAITLKGDAVATPVCTAPGTQKEPAIWGNLVVWADDRNADGLSGTDIYGYDLKRQREFAVTRNIGVQDAPTIYENVVVWRDWRNASASRYGTAGLFGARLEDKPTTDALPVGGALSEFDGRIEVVWPHSGQPGTATDMVNIGVYLFSPTGTTREVPCSFNPPLELWAAQNNRPAEMVERINQRTAETSPATWSFNDVDVRWAQNPSNQIFFFLKSDPTVAFASNVWSHASDARTFQPQAVPIRSAQAAVPTEVDALIQIVWPHGGVPVVEASQVNISANLFVHGTDISVPADWTPTVSLLRSLNNGVSEVVATGTKRLVTEGSLVYPTWDFNDIDVSQARDPQNKYYFRLDVDGVTTHSTVWSHGADARTYFPAADVPECLCNSCP